MQHSGTGLKTGRYLTFQFVFWCYFICWFVLSSWCFHTGL